MIKDDNNSRRKFIKLAAASSAALGVAPISNIFGSESSSETFQPAEERIVPLSKGKSVMGLRSEPLKTVRIAVIGLGMRGSDAVRRLLQVEGVEVKAIADIVPQTVKEANKKITDAGFPLQPDIPAKKTGNEYVSVMILTWCTNALPGCYIRLLPYMQ